MTKKEREIFNQRVRDYMHVCGSMQGCHDYAEHWLHIDRERKVKQDDKCQTKDS
jgi:hypothetical protein